MNLIITAFHRNTIEETEDNPTNSVYNTENAADCKNPARALGSIPMQVRRDIKDIFKLPIQAPAHHGSESQVELNCTHHIVRD